jgi:hypothetical protein
MVFADDQAGWVGLDVQDAQALHFAHGVDFRNHPAVFAAVSFALSFQAFAVFFVHAFPDESFFVVRPHSWPATLQFHLAGFDPEPGPAHGSGSFPWSGQVPGFG